MFEQAFEKAETKAESAIEINADDYIGDDGLWHCGKCGTPKQSKVMIFGKVRTPMCLCKCEQERRDLEQEAEEKRQMIKRLRGFGFADSELLNFTFENDDSPESVTSKISKRYVKHFGEMKKDGKGLLFFGTVGTGKTFYAACIANALIDRGVPCLVTNFARLTNIISGTYDSKQEYLDSLNNYDLIVIDDLAAERNTEYMSEIIFNIIDGRMRSGKPLIVTTNLTSEELKYPTDLRRQRIYSRLLEMCLPVRVEGLDRRKEKLKEDAKKYSALLGM